jgi:hypothetical protein
VTEWAIVLLGTGLTTVTGLARYGLRLAFLRHVYNHGGRKDLDVAARATENRAIITRRCSCQHGRTGVAIGPDNPRAEEPSRHVNSPRYTAAPLREPLPDAEVAHEPVSRPEPRLNLVD